MNGRMAGLFVTLGLCTGLLFHTIAVSLGVAAIFAQSDLAFTALKLCGAGYLIYLAYKAFQAGQTDMTGGQVGVPLGKLYLRGLIMNITNPKVAIFFLAFLPQFADPERGSLVVQLVLLGALMAVATISVFGLIALGGGTLGGVLRRRPGIQTWINRMAGIVFVGLALKLVLAER